MVTRAHPKDRARRREQPVPSQELASVDWRRLLAYLRPHRGRMALAVLALLISSGLGLTFPLVIVRLLDSATQIRTYGALNMLAGVLLVIFLAQAAFGFLQSYLLASIGERIVYDLRTALYRHLQHLSLDFFAERRVGEVVSRLASDVTQMRTMLTTNITMLLSQMVNLVGAVVIVVSLNARLTLFILGLAPVLVLVAILSGRRIQRASTRVQDDLAAATVVAEEGLQGVRIVKSFGRERYETDRYDAAMAATLRASLRVALYNALFTSLMMFLGFGAITALIWYGGREVIAGQLTLGMISGFLIYGITIAGSLGGMSGLYAQLRAAVGGVRRVFDLLDAQPTVQDAPGAMAIDSCEGSISLEDVTFCYEPGAPVLRGVSLEIRAGEILALVGPSGAGKSTILNLIPRFYDPAGGRVALDGRDLRAITQVSLRDQLAIVPQDTMLFGGSIRENIRYGRLDASGDELIAAAKAANAHDFIMALPGQYETVVGERGTRLSGGQRQRIAIARALLKDPRILLLDEATSALDSESEGLVQEALHRLMQGRTTVIIAHRLSTVQVAHRIAVMDGGQIIELGNHADLVARGGMYARLYAMQFRNNGLDCAVVETLSASLSD